MVDIILSTFDRVRARGGDGPTGGYMSVKSMLAGAALALSTAVGAQAAVITFESAPEGVFAFGGYSEAGFRYEVESGGFYVNVNGNPGHDLEGYANGGGGALSITSEDSPLFTFDALDFWAYSPGQQGPWTLSVTGWRDGDVLGVDDFVVDGSSGIDWTFFGAENLAGLKLDRLSFELDAGGGYWEAVDNIRLTSVSAIPEPGVWALMIAGFGLAGAALRRNRASVAAG